jgi:hypothetical protein
MVGIHSKVQPFILKGDILPLNISDLLTFPCMLNAMDDAVLSQFVYDMGTISLIVDCYHCNSPKMRLLNATLNSESGNRKLQAAIQDIMSLTGRLIPGSKL